MTERTDTASVAMRHAGLHVCNAQAGGGEIGMSASAYVSDRQGESVPAEDICWGWRSLWTEIQAISERD